MREGLRELIAEAYADGRSRQQIADAIGDNCHKDTVTEYLKDDEIQAMIDRLSRERINRVTRKIDAALESRLEHVDKIDTETLLKIRKEMLPERIEIDDKTDRSTLVEELWGAADQDPELAQRLLAAGNAADAPD